MVPAWHQLVPISGHVEESETARKLQLYATSIKTSVSTQAYDKLFQYGPVWEEYNRGGPGSGPWIDIFLVQSRSGQKITGQYVPFGMPKIGQNKIG